MRAPNTVFSRTLSFIFLNIELMTFETALGHNLTVELNISVEVSNFFIELSVKGNSELNLL